MHNPSRTSSSRAATLGETFDPKKNAFAFLRCALAMLVIISHCYVLGRFGKDPLALLTGDRQTLGVLAVAMFFVLSGFLITRSALNLPSAGRFLWHRFLRIFPGYWVCLILCAFVLAPLIFQLEHGNALQIFSKADSPQAYVAGNVALFHLNGPSIWGVVNIWPRSIGHIFGGNPYQWVVNGSLWSLPYEWMCYLVVALLSVWGVLRRARFTMLAIFVVLWGAYAFIWFAPQLFRECFPYRCLAALIMLSMYFTAGALCYLYRERIAFSVTLVFIACLVLFGGLFSGCFGLVAPVAVPYVFLWLACKIPITRFDARGDFSYGLYIYAFPVQQALAYFGLPAAGFALYVSCSMLITLILAILSYRYVEAPCLRFKNIWQSPRRGEVSNEEYPTARETLPTPAGAVTLL